MCPNDHVRALPGAHTAIPARAHHRSRLGTCCCRRAVDPLLKRALSSRCTLIICCACPRGHIGPLYLRRTPLGRRRLPAAKTRRVHQARAVPRASRYALLSCMFPSCGLKHHHRDSPKHGPLYSLRLTLSSVMHRGFIVSSPSLPHRLPSICTYLAVSTSSRCGSPFDSHHVM